MGSFLFRSFSFIVVSLLVFSFDCFCFRFQCAVDEQKQREGKTRSETKTENQKSENGNQTHCTTTKRINIILIHRCNEEKKEKNIMLIHQILMQKVFCLFRLYHLPPFVNCSFFISSVAFESFSQKALSQLVIVILFFSGTSRQPDFLRAISRRQAHHK